MKVVMEPIETESSVVRCDGGGGLLGHPVVFLNLGKDGKVTCPYCSKSFQKAIYFSKSGNKTKGWDALRDTRDKGCTKQKNGFA